MLTDSQLDEIKTLLQSGSKLDAIKRYKDLTGASLLVVKREVETLAGSGGASAIEGMSDQQLDEILKAIESGNKLEAVKVYKEATNQSLMESKTAVEALISELEISDPEAVGKGGCGVVVPVLVLLLALAGSMFV